MSHTLWVVVLFFFYTAKWYKWIKTVGLLDVFEDSSDFIIYLSVSLLMLLVAFLQFGIK